MKWWFVGAGAAAFFATIGLFSLGYLDSFPVATTIVATTSTVIVMATLALGKRCIIFGGFVVVLIPCMYLQVPFVLPLLYLGTLVTGIATAAGLLAHETWERVPRTEA